MDLTLRGPVCVIVEVVVMVVVHQRSQVCIFTLTYLTLPPSSSSDISQPVSRPVTLFCLTPRILPTPIFFSSSPLLFRSVLPSPLISSPLFYRLPFHLPRPQSSLPPPPLPSPPLPCSVLPSPLISSPLFYRLPFHLPRSLYLFNYQLLPVLC